MKRAVVIFNPVAGNGRAPELSVRACEVLESSGWTVECLATKGPAGAHDLARSVAARVDLLVVVGGDGSVREAIAGLRAEDRRVAVAVVPCGNANVVARELRVPLDTEGALALLTDGREVAIDVGFANSEIFLAMVGIGWDARIVRNLDRLRASRLGAAWYRRWADSLYVLAGLAALFTLRRSRMRILVDGARLAPRFRAAVVANFRCYGKGWAMVPDADFASGRLHFQARKRIGFPFVAWQLVAAALWRRVPSFISDHGDGDQITITADRDFAVHVDGDYKGRLTEVSLRVQPAGALILAPRTDPQRVPGGDQSAV